MSDQKYLNTFRENGRKITNIRHMLVDYLISVRNLELVDKRAHELICKAGGEPAFKKVPGYHWSTCISLNSDIVHGIPKGNVEDGDLVTLDVGMYFEGTTTDTAISFVVGKAKNATQTFLKIGRDTLDLAVEKTIENNIIGDISRVIQQNIEKHGYNVTRDLTGHGLGRTMHELPSIPCFDNLGVEMRIPIKTGMVLAIEVMYMDGDWSLIKKSDGWTYTTRDRSLSAVYEVDVIVTNRGPEIITPI